MAKDKVKKKKHEEEPEVPKKKKREAEPIEIPKKKGLKLYKAPESDAPYSLNALLGELEKVVKIQSINIGAEDRISTGSLCLDIVLGGGITAGMYTTAGAEQSCKTTSTISILAASLTQNVEARVLWDAEGSTGSSMDYVENIFANNGVRVDMETLFGVKKGNKYVQTPVVYYRDEAEMDTFYDWLAAYLRRLPDKRFEAGRWWYIYENTPDNKSKYKDKMDRGMSKAQGAIYIPAKDGALQALVMIDSYPALLPESMDEDDPKAGLALAAREFAKNLPRVKGRLRKKRVAILGVNQLRKNPAAKFVDPNYEPGGESLRFFSDVRLHNTPRSLSGVPTKPQGKGQYEVEPSVSGEGEDTYRYIHVKARKNKLSTPNRETWMRLWVSDENQQANGFCLVWDTFYALYVTGQVTGEGETKIRKSMTLNIAGLGEAKKTINWFQFKQLIIGTDEEKIAVCNRLGYKPMNLRKGLFKMIRSGKMEELYSAHHNASMKKAAAKEAAKATKSAIDDDDDLDDDDE